MDYNDVQWVLDVYNLAKKAGKGPIVERVLAKHVDKYWTPEYAEQVRLELMEALNV